jgi:hypothetical protein
MNGSHFLNDERAGAQPTARRLTANMGCSLHMPETQGDKSHNLHMM